MLYAHISHVYNLLPIDTLARMLKKVVKCSYKCQDICDRTVCNTVQYQREIYLVCHFSYSYLSNRIIRGNILRIYDLTNPVQISQHKCFEQNIRVRKDWRVWLKLNHPGFLNGMIQRHWMTKTRNSNKIQRGTEVRRRGPRPKVWNSKTILTSRACAVT